MTALVLVLNANFEPLNVCTTRRAIGMMLDGKAALIANGRGTIRAVSTSFPLPSVIQLQHMVHRPRPHIKLTRHEIFRRDNYSCQYCGRKTPTLTIDHVIPRHLGGEHSWTNVVTACASCNHQKGGRRLTESTLRLLSNPREPVASSQYLFGPHLPENEAWVPFISGW
jgi:5-methylcytosine-specific restriction endonuclease McrA